MVVPDAHVVGCKGMIYWPFGGYSNIVSASILGTLAVLTPCSTSWARQNNKLGSRGTWAKLCIKEVITAMVDRVCLSMYEERVVVNRENWVRQCEVSTQPPEGPLSVKLPSHCRILLNQSLRNTNTHAQKRIHIHRTTHAHTYTHTQTHKKVKQLAWIFRFLLPSDDVVAMMVMIMSIDAVICITLYHVKL